MILFSYETNLRCLWTVYGINMDGTFDYCTYTLF